MIIFDWHLDLSWNALEWNRDLRRTCDDIRKREKAALITGQGRGTNTVSLPDMRRGKVAVVSATLLARHDRDGPKLAHLPKSGFESAEASCATAKGQLAYYHALERAGDIRILRDWTALDKHVRQWQSFLDSTGNAAPGPLDDAAAKAAPPLGFVISMEGADPILTPGDLDEWVAGGLRIISLSHYGNSRYSHGTGTPGPLNPPAWPLLKRMRELGVVLDVTHLADDAMDEVLSSYDGPLLASHHNCRALVDRQRQLRDADIRGIVGKGGIIGAAFDNWMLDFDLVQGTGAKRRHASLDDVLNHVEHVCKLAGSRRHVALGTDLDGGFGTEQSPLGLDTIADLQKLPAMLAARGWSPSEITGFAHGNWLELMRRAWEGRTFPR